MNDFTPKNLTKMGYGTQESRVRALAVRKSRQKELDGPIILDSLLWHTKKMGISRTKLKLLILGDMQKHGKTLEWLVSANQSPRYVGTLRDFLKSIKEQLNG